MNKTTPEDRFRGHTQQWSMKNSVTFSQKIKDGNILWASIPISETLKRIKNRISKKYLYFQFPYSIIHNIQDVETT